MKKFVFIVLFSVVLVSTSAFAGKTHIGDGDTRGDACAVAEKKAKIAAKNSGLNGTCYDACKFESCTKKGAGNEQYWSCKTTSANHKGSCEKDPSKIRVYE